MTAHTRVLLASAALQLTKITCTCVPLRPHGPANLRAASNGAPEFIVDTSIRGKMREMNRQ